VAGLQQGGTIRALLEAHPVVLPMLESNVRGFDALADRLGVRCAGLMG
jgi:hypothetical protein